MCGVSYLLWCFICLSLCAVSLRRRITGGKCPEWFKYQIYQMGTDGGRGRSEPQPTSQHGSWWLHCVRIIVCHCVTLVTHNVVFRRKYPSLLSLPNTTNSPPKIKYTTFAKRSTTLPPQDKIQYKFTKPELGAGGGGGCPAQLLPARGYLRLKASLFKILAATLEHFLPAPDPRLQSHHSSVPPRQLSVLSWLQYCTCMTMNI